MKYMKKLLGLIVALTVVVTGIPTECIQAEYLYNSEYAYTLADGEVTITTYRGNDTEIEIPSTIDGYPVTKIDGLSIMNLTDTSIKRKVTIPEGVKEIGKLNGATAKSIQEISIPESVEKIAEGAFTSCSSLEIVHYNVSSSEIQCNSLFLGCINIKEIYLGNKVKVIGNSMFFSTKINEITIPESVEKIGKNAFAGCGKLETVYFNAVHVEDCEDYQQFSTTVNKVVLGDQVEYIGKNLFTCVSIESIVIPDSVKVIRCCAFKDCRKLKEVTIPKNLQVIENGAFYTSDIETINYNAMNATAQRSADSEDQSKENYLFCLKTLNFGNQVEYLNGSLFSYTSVKNVEFPKSLKVIGNEAFKSCYALEYLSIPRNVEEIKKEAFGSCGSLKVVEIDNPTCKIDEDENTISDSAVIVGYQDSTAHDYAIAHNRTFIPFESDCLMKKKISIQVDEKTSSEEIGMTDDEIFQKLENYSVLDGSILTVNEEGTICGVALGKTKIILMNEEKTALKIFEVEVIGKEPEEDTTTTSETTTKEETVAEDTSKARSTKKPTVLKSSKILKIKAKKKSLKICWKKVAGIGGYQLQYSKNKNFKKKKTITIRTGTRTSQTIKRLNSKKIYYVRICTYQKIGKKILKSAWSKVRQKKTK